MPLAPLTHELSNFEHIEILRHEIEQFEEELKKTESQIRAVLYQVEKQRFLMTVHPVFQHAPEIVESEALPEMYTTRETLASALDAMKTALAELEAASGPAPERPQQQRMQPPGRSGALHPAIAAQPHAQPGGLPQRKNRFDAF